MTMDPTEAFLQRFEESRELPCFEAREGRSFSYQEMWWQAERLAARWRDQGARPGATVAFLLPNHVALPCGYLACLLGGLVACPILESTHPGLVEEILELVEPTLVVRELPEFPEMEDPPGPGAFRLERDPAAPYLIMFTSGLTGKPKAMLHSARGVLGSARAFGRLTGMSPATRIYHVLPMAYMAGLLNTFLAPLMAGATVVEGPLFSPAASVDFWTRPLERGVDTLGLTPTIAAALCRLTRDLATRERVGRSIRQVQCTSASIPAAVRGKFHEHFGLPLQDCYGMTELGGPLTFQAEEDARAQREGTLPLPELDLELRGAPGEEALWIRSPFSMLGYMDAEGLIRPFDDEGFLDTGDLAAIEDGRLRITGRRKELIIRGGVNVAPTRVESALGLMPGVEEVAVVGVDHPFWGEEIVACLVPCDPAAADLVAQARRFCLEALGAHERPDRYMIMPELPRSFIGKIEKRVLRQRAAAAAPGRGGR